MVWKVWARTAELETVNSHLSLEIAPRRNTELVQQETLKELASRNATLEHARSGGLKLFSWHSYWGIGRMVNHHT